MTSASEDKNSAPDDEVPAENLALMTRILSAPIHGLTTEEVRSVFVLLNAEKGLRHIGYITLS
ncbi:hypothetical protein Hanom_Chr03g00182531 [Helianthus anomalus]